ncbi:hypothetical protein GBAR_LOCUS22359 [Geodia barretti]|uniref:CASP-like protein n=1 Tax=Geodia barretti TaxID=519541 RepID=A0AA35WZX4_GEOBA|nr:hypothetical protein GBAR_LOCUS22359 [Geodia barretti]
MGTRLVGSLPLANQSYTLLGSLPALIASAVALGLMKNIPLRLYDYDDADDRKTFDDVTRDENESLRNSIYMATGLAIGVTCLGAIIQLLFIPFRLWLFSGESFLIKIFLVFDIVISFVLAAGHNVAGVMLTTHSIDIKWFFDYVQFINKDDPEKIRNAMAASSALCSNATFMFIILAVFMLFFLYKDWNKTDVNTASLNKTDKLLDQSSM